MAAWYVKTDRQPPLLFNVSVRQNKKDSIANSIKKDNNFWFTRCLADSGSIGDVDQSYTIYIYYKTRIDINM